MSCLKSHNSAHPSNRVPVALAIWLLWQHTALATPTSVGDVKDAIKLTFADRTALILGNRNGAVGGAGTPDEPLAYITASTSPDSLPDGFVAVAEDADSADVLRVAAQSQTAAGAVFAPAGVVVLPGAGPTTPAPTAPLQPYYLDYSTHPWNAQGKDLLGLALPVPAVLATPDVADSIRRAAQRNTARGFDGALHRGDIQAHMMMNSSSDSLACIAAATCLPIGGNSVWAAMPPLPASGEVPDKPTILVLTHWDSQALFRSAAQGAESAYSGLISMLVAADVLSRAGRGEDYSKHVVFMTLSGEAYDLMGSRRLLWELRGGANATRGLSLDSIDTVIELGMTGLGATEGTAPVLYAHRRPTAAASVLLDALTAAGSAPGSAEVRTAGGPGLPPASLLLWSRALPAADALYLGDFDTAFKTPHFWGHGDTGDRVQPASVAAAAVSAARALHALASGSADVLQIDLQAVEQLTTELLGCLLRPGGLSCALVQHMTSTFQPDAEQYASVLLYPTRNDQDPDANSKKNVERFVWEFLANRTFTGEPHLVPDAQGEEVGCDPVVNTCPAGEVCMHLHPGLTGVDARGKCVRATAKYVPAYSTALSFVRCARDDATCAAGWRVDADSAADAWAAELSLPADPIWTETYNLPISTTTFLQERGDRDGMVLGLGLAVTVVVGGALAYSKRAYGQAMKAR